MKFLFIEFNNLYRINIFLNDSYKSKMIFLEISFLEDAFFDLKVMEAIRNCFDINLSSLQKHFKTTL